MSAPAAGPIDGLAAAVAFALVDVKARLAATPAARLVERKKLEAERDHYARALQGWRALN